MTKQVLKTIESLLNGFVFYLVVHLFFYYSYILQGMQYILFSSFLCFLRRNYFSILVQSQQNKSIEKTKDLCVCMAIDSLRRPLYPSGVVVYQGKNARRLMTLLFWFTFLCGWIENFAFLQHIRICCSSL